jgi:hypothetical protein
MNGDFSKKHWFFKYLDQFAMCIFFVFFFMGLEENCSCLWVSWNYVSMNRSFNCVLMNFMSCQFFLHKSFLFSPSLLLSFWSTCFFFTHGILITWHYGQEVVCPFFPTNLKQHYFPLILHRLGQTWKWNFFIWWVFFFLIAPANGK